MPDNPFYNSLPKWLTLEEFSLAVTGSPEIVKPKLAFEKMRALRRMKRQLFIVLPRHYNFYLTLRGILDESYENRDYKSFIEGIKKIANWRKNPNKLPKLTESPVFGTSLIGDVGIGKSTFLQRCLQLIPEKISHNDIGITQVPHIKVDCTSKGSVGQIFLSIFSELDRIAQEDYSIRFNRLSVERMLVEVASVSKIHQIGMILVDEINNLGSETSETSKRVINTLKRLTNDVGVPIVYVGTPKAKEILFEDLQIGTRAEDVGYTEWERLHEFDLKGMPDEEWNYFMDALWKYNVLDESTLLTEEIKSLYYKETQGLIRRLINLHVNAQMQAINSGSKSLTLTYINDAIKINMKGNQEKIQAIRLGSLLSTEVSHSNGSAYSTVAPKAKETLVNSIFKNAKKVYEKISEDQLKEVIVDLINEEPNLNEEKYYLKLEDRILELSGSDSVKKKKPKGKPIGELISLTENAKCNEDYYQLLFEAGIVPNKISIDQLI